MQIYEIHILKSLRSNIEAQYAKLSKLLQKSQNKTKTKLIWIQLLFWKQLTNILYLSKQI